MSPIIDLQRRLVEAGRIRTGGERSERRPGQKLETFRLTSRDESRVKAAAELYGGDPKPWREGEWQVYTEASSLDVLVIPGQTLSQWYELYRGGNCVRRCDGVEQTNGSACECPGEYDERRELAADGKACKVTTRLTVLLPRLPGIGTWRLEAHGFYAASELAASASLLEQATARGILLPARLRLDQRKAVRDGQTFRFAVPVLEIDASLEQVRGAALGTGTGEVLALPAPSDMSHTPARAEPPPTPSRALDALSERKPRRSTAEPIGREGPKPQPGGQRTKEQDDADGVDVFGAPLDDGEASVAVGESPPSASPSSSVERMATDAQRRMLKARWDELGLTEDRARDVIEEVTGQRSTASIPLKQVDAVLALLSVRSEEAQ